METAEQKHLCTCKQVTALEKEVRHLKCKDIAHEEEACQLREEVSEIKRLRDQKEKEQQVLHEQLHMTQQQVEAYEEKLKERETEMDCLRQQLKGAELELKKGGLKIQQEKETAAIFKQKYSTAIEKIHKIQGQVELLEEDLRYSQQQLGESELATLSVKGELAVLERRYQEKVNQWESSQEALDQLTDDLQIHQNILRESQQKVDHFKNLAGSLQDQMDSLMWQKVMMECDVRSHSHSDEDCLSLSRTTEQLNKCRTEQVEQLVESEKAILEMKSELARRAQHEEDMKQRPAATHHRDLNNHSQLEHQLTCLINEVTCLKPQLPDTQKVHVALLKQGEEQLKDSTQESARRSREVDVQRGEVQRLEQKLLKEQEKMKSAIRENQNLSTLRRQLEQELEKLSKKHQVTVEELAARAEEARRMEGFLTEGKLAEEKIRSMAVKLEKEVTELRENLQQSVDRKLKAERENKDTQELVETVQLELEGIQLDNANLRHESQQVMTNLDLWITEQKAASVSLSAQMKAQNRMLLTVTEEKERLQEANDTLKVEVERLKGVVDEKERDMEHLKAQIRDGGMQQGGKTVEKKSCVTRNLNKIEDMQCRLQSNLKAISMLNQQFNVLCRENMLLHRQLEEERAMRRQVERQLSLPTTSQHCSSTHLPLFLCARPPIPTSFSSTLGFPCPPSSQTAVDQVFGIR